LCPLTEREARRTWIGTYICNYVTIGNWSGQFQKIACYVGILRISCSGEFQTSLLVIHGPMSRGSDLLTLASGPCVFDNFHRTPLTGRQLNLFTPHHHRQLSAAPRSPASFSSSLYFPTPPLQSDLLISVIMREIVRLCLPRRVLPPDCPASTHNNQATSANLCFLVI